MEPTERTIMPIRDTFSKYPGQWLAVEVLERDKVGQPVTVKVISTNIDIHSVRKQAGTRGVCTYYTGPVPETTTVLML